MSTMEIPRLAPEILSEGNLYDLENMPGWPCVTIPRNMLNELVRVYFAVFYADAKARGAEVMFPEK